MSAIVVKRAFEHLHAGPFTVSAFPALDPRRLEEVTVRGNVPDARYKIALLAASTDYRSAIVKYRGVRYYVTVSHADKSVTVERA